MIKKKRLLVKRLVENRVKIARAAAFVEIPRSSFHYRSRRDPDRDAQLRLKIQEIALRFPFYGYRRIYHKLREDGTLVNHKKVYRLYLEMNLKKGRKRKKKFIPCNADSLHRIASGVNDVWVTDFIEDSTADGRKLRILAIEDQYSRKVVGFRVGSSIRGSDVADVLDRAIEIHGRPTVVRSDNGPEYISRVVGKYLERKRIVHERIEPGKPIQNCYAESFMSRFRQECLNLHIFRNSKQARRIIGEYIEWFNNERLHSSLGYRTPDEVYAREGPDG